MFVSAAVMFQLETSRPFGEYRDSAASERDQDLIQHAYAAYVMATIGVGLSEALGPEHVHDAMMAVTQRLATFAWFNQEDFDRIWQETLRQLPFSHTIRQATVLPYLGILIGSLAWETDLRFPTEMTIELDAYMGSQRETLVGFGLSIAKQAVDDGWLC